MIGPFEKEYRFLSNFYEGDPIFYKGFIYITAEHAFQAAKATNRFDAEYVALAATPGLAKGRGRKIKLRPDWDFVKDRIMYEIVHEKFFQNGHLAKLLLETGEEKLVEVNTWGDFYWGADSQGKGQNKLGEILMKVREELNAKKNTRP